MSVEASNDSNSRSEYFRKYHAKKYAENTELCNLRSCVKYYRKRRSEGKTWIPRPYSRLALYCKERDLDVEAIINGTAKLVIDT